MPATECTPDDAEKRATQPIRCSEVWGGNHAVETALDLPGLEGSVISRPYHGDQGGGDVHLVSSCGTGRITRLMLADIAGHGEHVAELGRRFRRTMQRYMNHIAPQELAGRMNHDMAELAKAPPRLGQAKPSGSGKFATAVILTYFAPDGGLSLCNAGHPPPMLYRAEKQQWRRIEQPDPGDAIENLPLGILEDAGYHAVDLTLHPGDVLFAYTDCLTEAAHPEAGQLGIQGLVDVLNELTDNAPAEPASAGGGEGGSVSHPLSVPDLLANLTQRGYTWDDDLTAVTLRCTGRSEGADLKQKLSATARTLLHAFDPAYPFPWPEVSWLNLGGALLPGVKRER